MKNLVPVLVLIALAANSLIGKAAEPITGAFGFKLGTIPNVDTVKDVSKADGKVTYYVAPEKPDAAYQRYSIGVTPQTKKIFSIRGSADFESKAAGLVTMKAAFKKLESIYGPGHPMEDWGVIESGDRYIMMTVNETPNKKAVLLVVYHDKKLEKLGEQETKANQFDGAFGFKFGEVFDPSTALEKRPVSAGGYLYVVKPPSPNELFAEYLLVITPKSRQITGVWATRIFKERREALEKLSVLKTILEKKYGKASGETFQSDKFEIKHTDETVSLAILENSDKEAVLVIKYNSDKLYRLLIQEMKEETAGKVDKSGL